MGDFNADISRAITLVVKCLMPACYRVANLTGKLTPIPAHADTIGMGSTIILTIDLHIEVFTIGPRLS